MSKVFRIGTRDSELAVWQAYRYSKMLQAQNISSELIFIKSEGDKDLITPFIRFGCARDFYKNFRCSFIK